jgi:c-di-AMP phosphodiesterase-like protein
VNIASLSGFFFIFFNIEKYPRKFFHYFHILGIIFFSFILLIISFIFENDTLTLQIIQSVISGNSFIRSCL